MKKEKETPEQKKARKKRQRIVKPIAAKVIEEPQPEAPETPETPETPEAPEAPPTEINFEEELKQYEQTPPPEEPEISAPEISAPEISAPEAKPDNSHLISGYLFLLVIDVIAPSAFSFIAVRMLNKKVTAEEIRLTDRERLDLEPLADAAAKELLKDMSPVQMFFISLAAIYAGKIIFA